MQGCLNHISELIRENTGTGTTYVTPQNIEVNSQAPVEPDHKKSVMIVIDKV